MLPTQDTDHTNEALAKLLEQSKLAPVINGLLESYIWSVQDLENAIWTVINSRFLANATNAQLDLLGRIVGESRQARTDADYLAAITLRIRVNRSQGYAEDIIAICALAIGATINSGAVAYQEAPVMAWQVDLTNITASQALALISLLPHAKEDGSRGMIGYSLWPDSQAWVLDSDTSVHPAGATGIDDAVADSLGYNLSSGSEI